jgi:CubicO group peptidase (beta-lactamase class C family)
MRLRPTLGALILVCVGANGYAATPAQRIATIESSITPLVVIKGEPPPPVNLATRMEQLHVVGVSVAVFNAGKIEWAKAYGYADKERGTRATPDTLFEAGSISKPIAALAALELVERGTLDLDANVNDKLKSWHLPENQFTTNHKVTLRNILNHTAGTTVWGFPGMPARTTFRRPLMFSKARATPKPFASGRSPVRAGATPEVAIRSCSCSSRM